MDLSINLNLLPYIFLFRYMRLLITLLYLFWNNLFFLTQYFYTIFIWLCNTLVIFVGNLIRFCFLFRFLYTYLLKQILLYFFIQNLLRSDLVNYLRTKHSRFLLRYYRFGLWIEDKLGLFSNRLIEVIIHLCCLKYFWLSFIWFGKLTFLFTNN